MAYKINRTDEHIVLPDGPSSAREVRRAMKQQKNPEFYELEPAEVIKVYLDEEDLPKLANDKPDYSQYGFIEARMCISNDGEHDIILVAPLEVNIKDYPYPGEYVIVVEYFGTKFYTQKLNLYNNVDTNILPGLSKIHNPWKREGYKDNLPKVKDRGIRQLKAEEGDITFNGRFGNSIRFGSNVKIIKETETTTSNGHTRTTTYTGKKNSPNIIIRAGQGVQETVLKKPVHEDINADGSSIWMTTDQVVPLFQSSVSRVPDLQPKELDGKQIILNSDRIVFNSKGTDTFVYSNRDINLVSNNRIVLEGHKNVYLGTAPKQGETTGWVSDNSNIQPVLRGDQTMNLVDSLLDALIDFAKTIGGAKGTVVDFIVPISDIIEGASGLKGALLLLKDRLDEPKSDIVKTN